jgi:inner membrane protein
LDPVSQAVVGAAAAHVFLTDRLGKQAFACGALGERFVRDFARFAWFADGFVARDPADPAVLADMRYSLDPGGFQPLWGVRFHTDGRENPVEWVELMRGRGRGFSELWQLITARSPRLRSWLL